MKLIVRYIREQSRAASKLGQSAAQEVRERFFLALVKQAVRLSMRACTGPVQLDQVCRNLRAGLECTADNFSDALPDHFFDDPASLGRAYQVWNEPKRDAHSWGVSKSSERRSEEIDIASVTQVFTDSYIADSLATGCLDLWARSRGESNECPSICDPAVGTGHLLLAAVKALICRGVPVESVAYRVYGFDIDPLCIIVCRAALFSQLMRAGFSGDPIALSDQLAVAITALQAPYGALDRELMSRTAEHTFQIVIANPPYLGRRKLPMAFRDFLDREYPAASVDLCAAFLQRCIELLGTDGILGVIASDKWMRLRQYDALRCGAGNFGGIYGALAIEGLYELGERAFSAEAGLHDGMRAAIVFGCKTVPASDHRVPYADLSLLETQEEKQRALLSCISAQGSKSYVTYIVQNELGRDRNVFLKAGGLPPEYTDAPKRVDSFCNIIVGIQTNNDANFVRYIWQVPDDRSGWRVHCRGGGYGRWAGLNRWAINWPAGETGFFSSASARERAEKWATEEGWVYSWLANGNLGVRRKQSGWSFGRAAAGAIFSDDLRIAAFLNSRIASTAVRSIGGKIQLPEGTVKSIPRPTNLDPIREQLVSHAVMLKEALVSTDPTEALFSPRGILLPEEALLLEAVLLVVEAQLEQQVEESIGLSPAQRRALLDRLGFVSGWYEPAVPLKDHPVMHRIPGIHRDVVQSCVSESISVTIPAQRYPIPSLEQAIATGKLESHIDSSWLLPASGTIESVCRAFHLHPFDAFLVMDELMRTSKLVKERLYRDYVTKCLITEVLTQVGHRWWSDTPSMGSVKPRQLSFDDICSIATSDACYGMYAESVDTPLRQWVTQFFLDRHDRMFFGNSPLVVDKHDVNVLRVGLRGDV